MARPTRAGTSRPWNSPRSWSAKSAPACAPFVPDANFTKLSGWPHAARAIGAEGLHFHDLRHTGNVFPAASGAGLRDLMVRMGHDSERAAIIYQHAARGADQAIAEAMDAHVEAQQTDDEDGDDGAAGMSAPAG